MSNLGIKRERQVRKLLEDDGYWCARAAGSLGDADIVALKCREDGSCYALLVEVKCTAGGPYEHFRPGDRAELVAAAVIAGATATLCWWPKWGQPKWIGAALWP